MDSSGTHPPRIMAQRLARLSRIGATLMSERNEIHLHHLIVENARDLVGATMAALTLRPVNEEGEPLVPSEGSLFHLAAIVGVTPEQEKQLRHMPLGGEGLLAPIFRHGISVRVADAVALRIRPEESPTTDLRTIANQAAFAYAYGQASTEGLRALGIPHGHLQVHSFLGAPLLDQAGGVRGGLLLGHSQPDQFTQEDEIMLTSLAAQAAVALENVRWYRIAQMRAQELDAVFERSTNGVTLVDLHGHVLRENRAAHLLREWLQMTPEGEEALEALLLAPARQALAGEIVRENVVRVDEQGGTAREYLVSASLLPEPTVSASLQPQDVENLDQREPPIARTVVVWHDVTEARRLLIEQRARIETESQRALLQLILDEMPSSTYLVRGKDARLVLANRAATTVFGALWRPGQPMSEFLSENHIRVFGVDGHPLALEQFATLRALRQGKAVLQHQETICHADGTMLPVMVNAVALKGRDRSFFPAATAMGGADEAEPSAIVVHLDVTAIKAAEQLKDEFIGIVAHELHTPLAILKGFVQTLLNQTARGKGPELAAWQMQSLQGIDLVQDFTNVCICKSRPEAVLSPQSSERTCDTLYLATARLIDLAEDVLDVTRVHAGRLELQREPTDLVALIRRVLVRRQLTTERHTLSLVTEAEHLVATVDPRRIEQVLINLIGNAIKYSPEGGSIAVTIRADVATDEIRLSISDQGIGIPSSEQSQVFGRFARASNAQVYEIGGAGLGLYLCRGLVEQHGGRIWFESAEGQGSTFFVALPLVPN
jgi:signal transduction histidine kinase